MRAWLTNVWRGFRALPLFVKVPLVVVVTFVVLSFDWRGSLLQTQPVVIDAGHSTGALRAGAAKVSLNPPFPTPIGGFTIRGDKPFNGILNDMAVRALVLEVDGKRVGLVSAELCVLPHPLREKVLAAVADLKLDDLVIGATHTHSGIGGYWDNLLAEWIGLARYDKRIESFVVQQLSQALHEAAGSLRLARLSVGKIEASNFAYNRDTENGPVDNLMVGARVVGLDGKPIANVVIYAAHPTIVRMQDMRLSGDWPGAMMSALEEGGPPTLFFQGAVGDVTWGKRSGEMSREERVVRFGRAVASDARGALAAGGDGDASIPLDWARVRIGLPKCDLAGAVPAPFDRFVSNLFCWLSGGRTTEVSYLRAGSLQLANVPGEVVANLGISWRGLLGGGVVTSLMDDYVGYVESPALVEARQGEAKHSYFGPALAPLVLQGLTTAHDTAIRH